ncbi:MAG: DNA polymerase III subunit alpha [Muribaculaceae bacterium]|nr:DNA polymerase III subunit alpha [Muribaculaceae bacterium]
MYPFVHLHVHSQYSVLDGQASIEALVDKAMADNMPAIAITDHGNMFGIKEFYNYVNKKNGKIKDAIKKAQSAVKNAQNEEERQSAEEELRKASSKKPFKPIFRCEMYVAATRLQEHIDKKDTGRHLIVLAKNEKGYHNLVKLVSKAWTEGFYSHPRTDKYELAKYHEGLIVCSACIGGEIPRLILQGNIEEAEKQVLWFKETFGEDYYLELQRHQVDNNLVSHLDNNRRVVFERQQAVNPVLIEFAKKHNIKLVCTNDVHFVNQEDAEAHERLICVSTGKKLSDESRMVYTKQEWMKSTAEMNELFGDIPEAITNTIDIADKIEFYNIDHAPIMPNFEIPADFGTEEEYRARITHDDLFNEFTRDENGNVVLSEDEAKAKIEKLGGYEKLYRIKFEADYLKKLAYEGAERRYGSPLSPELEERIKFELHIMKTMGFPGYFLIVQDFINAARKQLGVSVGPGRGSAAGSCVAYCLGITQIDPVKYDLLFERFLNPDRISLPDIDIDFDDDGRADVLKYVTEKYGEEKVAHIITYGTMAAKSAIKDVARVEDLPLSESDRLTKLIPAHMPVVNGKELKPTLKNCYEYVNEFKTELASHNPTIARTLKYAQQLEGNVRNTGVHACGVIICRDDITDWVPVSTAVDKTEGKLLVTQYEGRVIEETGLIKMDFLGLKTLSILKEAVQNIKLAKGVDIDLDNIPIDDPATYKLYSEGRTKGTFQFESAGMQKYLRELQPSTFEDLIAMNALYRPGPMDYIPDFISRKHGRSPIVYDIPIMEKYLKDTYGVTVYQEQVMLLSRLLANFTRGESDTLRKAMGKKLIDKMNHLKGKFLEGGQANGHKPEVLEKIWADWEKFASYAFNKSHATCYSWVAFQTAYLKANYPAEYMAAVMSRNRNDITKLRDLMDECKAMHIQVKGPDVNESFGSFGVNKDGDIRFGIAAIKGVGENVAADIIKSRQADGPFKSIYDLVERVPLAALNRRTFESLAYAGAFDCFQDVKREDYFVRNIKDESFSEQLLRYGQLFQQASKQQAASLFGEEDMSLNTAGRPPVKPALEWPAAIKLERERELVGMYLSANPLDPFYMELNYGGNCNIKDLTESAKEENKVYVFGGMVTGYEDKISKKGSNYGKITLEDYTGSTEVMLFGNDYIKFSNFGKLSAQILVSGTYEPNYRGELSFKIQNIRLLEEVKGKMLTGITVELTPQDINDNLIDLFNDQSCRHSDNKGTLTFMLYDPELNRTVKLLSSLRTPLDRELVDVLNGLDVKYSFDKQIV